jgi:asparagine synthase (glutamine-hydrolysing)
MDVLATEPRQRVRSQYTWLPKSEVNGLFLDQSQLEKQDPFELMSIEYQDLPLVEQMARIDQKLDLMSLNLTYCDRMSMLCGVEARVPFLDFELVKFMSRIPTETKMRNGTLKAILRDAMRGRLPDEIIDREKASFTLPIRSWLGEMTPQLRDVFSEEELKRQGIFDPKACGRLLDRYLNNDGDLSYSIWSFYCVQLQLRALNV